MRKKEEENVSHTVVPFTFLFYKSILRSWGLGGRGQGEEKPVIQEQQNIINPATK